LSFDRKADPSSLSGLTALITWSVLRTSSTVLSTACLFFESVSLLPSVVWRTSGLLP
jgi:hypothetical protein